MLMIFKFGFYRAVQLVAKSTTVITCRPSVRPPVRLVDQDHIGWKY